MTNPQPFTLDRFKVLQKLNTDHFWYAGRQRMIANALRDRDNAIAEVALDIGCGPGAHLKAWSGYAKTIVGLDQYADQVDPAFLDGNTRLIAGDVMDLPFDDNSIDLMFALDVVEHVPDLQVLTEARRVLKPGGYIVVTVPAFQSLWSYRDDDAGHLRRYTKAQIALVIGQAGLRVNRMRFYQCLLFPLVMLSRFLGRKKPTTRNLEDFPPRFVNTFFGAVNRFEARLDARGLPMPIGSSIIVLARKP